MRAPTASCACWAEPGSAHRPGQGTQAVALQLRANGEETVAKTGTHKMSSRRWQPEAGGERAVGKCSSAGGRPDMHGTGRAGGRAPEEVRTAYG